MLIKHLSLLGLTALVSFTLAAKVDDDLLDACMQEQLETVKDLVINKGANVNHADAQGETPIISASFMNNLEIVKFLAEKGANVNHAKDNGFTALIWASFENNLEMVKYLVERGADLNHADNDDYTALIWAANQNSTETAKFLVEEKYANVHHVDSQGNTALSYASKNENAEMVKFLQDEISEQYEVDYPYFYRACAGEYGLGAVKGIFTADRGADLDAALSIASRFDRLETVRFLVGKGADVNHADDFGWTALDRASESNNLEMVKILVENGADVNHANKDGNTALMQAAEKDNLEMVKILVENGANVSQVNSVGWTALDIASFEASCKPHAIRDKKPEIVKYLQDQIAKGGNDRSSTALTAKTVVTSKAIVAKQTTKVAEIAADTHSSTLDSSLSAEVPPILINAGTLSLAPSSTTEPKRTPTNTENGAIKITSNLITIISIFLISATLL